MLCCYSYSNPALAYTQQYNVGDTGPNGGTVQSVDVTSTVTGTEVQLNGGFEETTTTTLYTETIIEQISTTETTTTSTTTTQETTSTNMLPGIDSNNWSSTGSVSFQGQPCSYSGGTASGEACTGPQSNTSNNQVTTGNPQNWNVGATGGGQITSDYVELTQNLTEAELRSGFNLNYGVTVESHNSNTSVPWCSKTSGDCKDRFKVTVTLYDSQPTNNNQIPTHTFTHYETISYSGSRDYSYTNQVSANTYNELWGQMELWGQDSGYHSGMYGPIFSDPFMTLTYDAITTITETITNIVLSTQETVYNTSEQTTTSVFIGDPTTDTTPIEIDYTDVDSFEIEIVNEDTGGGIEMEFSVEVDETTNVATVEMESTNMETGVVQVETIAEIDLNIDFGSFDTGPMDANMPSVESIEADIGSQIDTAVADAVAEIEIDLPDMSTDTTQMADAGPNVEMAPPSDAGPSTEVEVNTSEGNSNEPSTQETVSETESSSASESNVASENVQESSENVEQPVEESTTEPEGSDSGDSESGEDTSGSEAESDSSDSGDAESSDTENNESSSRGEESKGKSGNNSKSKTKDNKNKTKSNSEKKKEYVEKKVAEAKQKIATRILSAMADTYSAINETTKIALISSLADTKNFQAYLDKQNALPLDWYTDEQIYTEMPQLLDPASVLYNMAQDKIMEEMIMMQYED